MNAGGFVSVAVATILLAGCAVYHTAPLPKSPDLAPALPRQTLTMARATRFALAHNPDLAVARRAAALAAARAGLAGDLPDPTLSAGFDHPTTTDVGYVNAYTFGLAQELTALATHPAAADQARAERDRAALGLVWSQWRLAAATAGLYARVWYGQRQTAALGRTATLLAAQARHSGAALARRDVTLARVGADLVAAQDAGDRHAGALRALAADRAALRALLGVAPTARLRLADPGLPPLLPRAVLVGALSRLRRVRPDLLALQAGYRARNAGLRAAILEQFPGLALGLNRAGDTSGVQSEGLTLGVTLPLFGRAQDRVRVARADRAHLRAVYQARLDQATSESWRLWRASVRIAKRVAGLEATLPRLRRMARAGTAAYRSGELAPALYVELAGDLATRQEEIAHLKTEAWADAIALRLVLAVKPLIPATIAKGRG